MLWKWGRHNLFYFETEIAKTEIFIKSYFSHFKELVLFYEQWNRNSLSTLFISPFFFWDLSLFFCWVQNWEKQVFYREKKIQDSHIDILHTKPRNSNINPLHVTCSWSFTVTLPVRVKKYHAITSLSTSFYTTTAYSWNSVMVCGFGLPPLWKLSGGTIDSKLTCNQSSPRRRR